MSAAELKLLKRIAAAVERPTPEPVAVDYATAAKMLCTSKRSVERMVAEEKLRPIDLAGPKIPVAQLRALVEGKPRATRRPAKRRSAPELMDRVRALAAEAQEGTPHE